MARPYNGPKKRYSLFVLAILMLLGGIGVYLGSHNFVIRALGSLAVLACVYLVRISHIHDRPGLPVAGGQVTDLRAAKGPGRLAWGIAIALLLLLGISLYLLNEDAAHGGQEGWPAYLFFGVGMAFALVAAYIAAKIFGSSGR